MKIGQYQRGDCITCELCGRDNFYKDLWLAEDYFGPLKFDFNYVSCRYCKNIQERKGRMAVKFVCPCCKKLNLSRMEPTIENEHLVMYDYCDVTCAFCDSVFIKDQIVYDKDLPTQHIELVLRKRKIENTAS